MLHDDIKNNPSEYSEGKDDMNRYEHVIDSVLSSVDIADGKIKNDEEGTKFINGLLDAMEKLGALDRLASKIITDESIDVSISPATAASAAVLSRRNSAHTFTEPSTTHINTALSSQEVANEASKYANQKGVFLVREHYNGGRKTQRKLRFKRTPEIKFFDKDTPSKTVQETKRRSPSHKKVHHK